MEFIHDVMRYLLDLIINLAKKVTQTFINVYNLRKNCLTFLFGWTQPLIITPETIIKMV